jgi:hypothetical protein
MARMAAEGAAVDEPVEIRAKVKIDYLGPVSPHWEVRWQSGDKALIEEFAQRVHARLLMLPPHDPQFRRNRERIQRDAEREGIALLWSIDDEG